MLVRTASFTLLRIYCHVPFRGNRLRSVGHFQPPSFSVGVDVRAVLAVQNYPKLKKWDPKLHCRVLVPATSETKSVHSFLKAFFNIILLSTHTLSSTKFIRVNCFFSCQRWGVYLWLLWPSASLGKSIPFLLIDVSEYGYRRFAATARSTARRHVIRMWGSFAKKVA